MKELAEALVALQGELDNVTREKPNPGFKGVKYADLAAVWDAIREPLNKHGLCVVQLPCEAPEGQVGLRTIIIHKSGQSIEDRFFMPLKQPDNPQAAGSAITYARRYALMGAVGIAPEDDDGNKAAEGKQPTGAYVPAWEMVLKGWNVEFNEHVKKGDLDNMKSLWVQLKNTQVPETCEHMKSSLMSQMAQTIKEKLGK